MKKLERQGKCYFLKDDVYQFLDAYLMRIANFVNKYDIDEDVYQDILQMIDEKLTVYPDSQKISQKQAIQIVNDLGEPEAIFSDELSNQKVNKSELTGQVVHFYEKMQHVGWARPQKSAFFLGICAMFAEKLAWNVWLLRSVVWIFFLAGLLKLMGIGVMFYFFLALIFPRSERNYSQSSLLSYFLTQIRDLRLLFSNFCKQLWGLLSRGTPKSVTIFGKVFLGFFAFVRFCFLVFSCFGMLFAIVGGIVLFYVLCSGIVVEHMNISAFFPAIFAWATGFGIASAIGFFIVGVYALFKRKNILWILISSFIFACFAFARASIGTHELFTIFNTQNEQLTKEIKIPVLNRNLPFFINIKELNLDSYMSGWPVKLINESSFYNLIPSDEKDIRVVYTFDILGGKHEKFQKKLKLMYDKFSVPMYYWEKEHLNVGLSGNMLFKSEVPYLPIGISVDLYIPKDLKFKFTVNQSYNGFNLGVHRPEWLEKYGGNFKCNDFIFYKSDLNAFYCDVEFEKEEKSYLISKKLREYSDELALFMGTNWDYSFQNYENKKYWKVHSMMPLSSDEYVVKLSDRFFNLFIRVKVDLDSSGKLIIKKRELHDFEQKGPMNEQRLSSYQGLSNLHLDLQMVDKKQDLKDKIKELEKKLNQLEALEIVGSNQKKRDI